MHLLSIQFKSGFYTNDTEVLNEINAGRKQVIDRKIFSCAGKKTKMILSNEQNSFLHNIFGDAAK